MALPQFAVTGNVGEILGSSTSSVLDVTYPTTLRAVFSTNFENPDDLISYESVLYKIEPVYAAVKSNGDLTHATMSTSNTVVADDDPILLVASNGVGVTDFQYQFRLEEPSGTGWRTLTSWWFDAAIDGATIALQSVVPAPGTNRWRGPAANIVAGSFNDDDDLVLTNRDGTTTTPIELPAGTIAFVDNGDGTVQVG